MAARPIVKLPHSVLRNVADEVPLAEIPGARIQRLISDMKATLARAPDGIGLAAPQVGEPLMIFLVSEEAAYIDKRQETVSSEQEVNPKPQWEYQVFINPVLKKKSQKKVDMAEGCLSVPEKFGLIARAEKVVLEWYDERGKKHSRGFTKFFAQVIQHELDHLDGVLIIDRAKKLFDMANNK